MIIKVMTLNIWMGKVWNNAIAFLKEESPDILFLQEAYDEKTSKVESRFRMLQEICSIVGYQYYEFAATHAENDLERGNAILSKYPLTDAKSIFFDVPYSRDYQDIPGNYENAPRNMQHIVANIHGTELNLFNVHGIWGEHGFDTDRRIEMSNTIIKHVKDKENVVLAGDFNVQPNTKTIDQIENHLHNVFKDELVSTFNMEHKSDPGFASAVVDFMFVSKNMNVTEKESPHVNVSDHMPLEIMIELC